MFLQPCNVEIHHGVSLLSSFLQFMTIRRVAGCGFVCYSWSLQERLSVPTALRRRIFVGAVKPRQALPPSSSLPSSRQSTMANTAVTWLAGKPPVRPSPRATAPASRSHLCRTRLARVPPPRRTTRPHQPHGHEQRRCIARAASPPNRRISRRNNKGR